MNSSQRILNTQYSQRLDNDSEIQLPKIIKRGGVSPDDTSDLDSFSISSTDSESRGRKFFPVFDGTKVSDEYESQPIDWMPFKDPFIQSVPIKIRSTFNLTQFEAMYN